MSVINVKYDYIVNLYDFQRHYKIQYQENSLYNYFHHQQASVVLIAGHFLFISKRRLS